MTRNRLLPIAVAAALAGGMAAAGAVAQDASIEPGETTPYGAGQEIRTENGLPYVCTGIGKGSRDDARWNDFSAKLVYTVEGGGYLPGVTTRIAGGGGEEVVFAQWCDGPWLLVDLPSGEYEVTALAEDDQGEVHRHQARISVDAGDQTEQVITFPELPS